MFLDQENCTKDATDAGSFKEDLKDMKLKS
jgi:hypothetical protein